MAIAQLADRSVVGNWRGGGGKRVSEGQSRRRASIVVHACLTMLLQLAGGSRSSPKMAESSEPMERKKRREV